MRFVPLHSTFIQSIIELADREIGKSYYDRAELIEQIQRGTWKGKQLSYLAFDGDELIGFRLTSAPGQWEHGRGNGLSPDLWPFSLHESAYFQSCFISEKYMGRGIGRSLSKKCIESLIELEIPLVVAHSWKESPHNSSFRYLTTLGFRPVREYPEYWKDVDYICSRDGNPCRCTAIEMILDLSESLSS